MATEADVLELILKAGSNGLGIKALSRMTGIHRRTLERMLEAMEDREQIVRRPWWQNSRIQIHYVPKHAPAARRSR